MHFILQCFSCCGVEVDLGAPVYSMRQVGQQVVVKPVWTVYFNSDSILGNVLNPSLDLVFFFSVDAFGR